MYYCDTPHRGASRGGCNENAFSNATLVFMQSLTGNKTVVKLLAAGGTNGQTFLCRQTFHKVSWILSQPSSIPRT